jgi:hypothetical protein
MNPVETQAFELSGVVHLVRPAGIEVSDLEQLRAALEQAPERSLFFHTAGRLLRHPATEELPPDDFSHWVSGVVQDRQTGERMSFAAEGAQSAEALRAALIEVLASVPEKDRIAHDAPPGGEFVFLSAASVPVPTDTFAIDAHELIDLLSSADASVWFYHLIEEPWASGVSPLRAWLTDHGNHQLAAFLDQVAHSGRPIEDMRRRVLRRWRFNRLGQRVADAAGATEKERSEAGREAMSRLVRRIRPEGTP